MSAIKWQNKLCGMKLYFFFFLLLVWFDEKRALSIWEKASTHARKYWRYHSQGRPKNESPLHINGLHLVIYIKKYIYIDIYIYLKKGYTNCLEGTIFFILPCVFILEKKRNPTIFNLIWNCVMCAIRRRWMIKPRSCHVSEAAISRLFVAFNTLKRRNIRPARLSPQTTYQPHSGVTFAQKPEYNSKNAVFLMEFNILAKKPCVDSSTKPSH